MRDRHAWIDLLFEARQRMGLCVLDYMVTSNHVHLLVDDRKGGEVIPQSIQLVAGRSGQQYNRRKHRRGAFWEDRYHATAVESGEHFRQCLAYIDLNMVRAVSSRTRNNGCSAVMWRFSTPRRATGSSMTRG